MEKITYNGVNFYRRKDRNYFECGIGSATKLGSSLIHRVIWMDYYGFIEKDHHIHHIDDNPANNEISNLKSLHKSEHARHHYEERKADIKRKQSDWASSEKGKETLRQNIKKCRENAPVRKLSCACCGKAFETKFAGSKYCSQACYKKIANRGRHKTTCPVCGKIFYKNGNRKSDAKTCGAKCGWALRKAGGLQYLGEL